ncbi:BTAD domain-containing putative transcriptional regulator [Kribbella albertanoniae]|uniref:AfsR/SARP family transcriptional regulator n=1 Tax=Kribbella albertanoniae TaxID=1266829 RepID=UPI0014052399|nr:BTAD domain-containing putative transcriptional regulator [Kribbella albertanoniae]
MTEQLRIELLGPLRVLRDGEQITVGAHRLQTLLAVLALRAGQICTAEELLDLVWEDNPPGTGLKVLPPYIYRLRRILPADFVARTADGYVLRLPAGSLDVDDFETAAAAAGRLRESGDLDSAAAEYTRALAHFRGEPLAGLSGSFLAAQRHRLTERRDKVFGDRVDLDLDRGRASELIAELVPAVEAKPFDERLAGQLMRALAADARQADALAVYTRTRETLVDQLGVEPGPALRAIHQNILRNEAAARTRDELPYAGASFVGREREVAALVQALGPGPAEIPPVVAVDGMGGVGKTALVVHTARRLSPRYPDGVLYVDLHGHSPSQQPRNVKAALDHLLVGAGVGATAIPTELEAARSLWRTTVAGRRMLIVLDNVANSSTVLPLLPGSPTCGVLITSRNQLTGVDVRERLHLDLLTPTDATDLLTQLVGAERAGEDVAASNGLIRRCGSLPLALRIAGARLRHRPSWTVAHVNERLDRADRRLAELTADGIGVTATFALSYDQLQPELQRFFRLLSVLPGRDLDQYGAAALLDCTPHEASDLAEALVDANLLLQPVPGRYEPHDLIREYAAQLAAATDPPAALTAAADRLLEYYVQVCFNPFSRYEGMWFFEPGRRPPRATPSFGNLEHAKAWADAEADNLAAAVEYSATAGDAVRTWQLALAAVNYLERRGKVQQQNRVLELALAAAESIGDLEAQARVLLATGRLIRMQQGAHASVDKLRDGLARLPADGDLLLRGHLYAGLGTALRTLDPEGEALALLREAARLGRELKNDRLLTQALTSQGIIHANAPNHAAAVEAYEEAVAVFERTMRGGLMADALSGLTGSYLGLGRIEDAIATGNAAYELAVELGNKFSMPWALGALGKAYRARGDLELAVSTHRRAVVAAEQIGSPMTMWSMQLHLGTSLLAVGDIDGALGCYQPVLEQSMAAKDHIYVVETLDCLANHALATDQRELAVDYLHQSLAVADEHIPSRSAGLREKLAKLSS